MTKPNLFFTSLKNDQQEDTQIQEVTYKVFLDTQNSKPSASELKAKLPGHKGKNFRSPVDLDALTVEMCEKNIVRWLNMKHRDEAIEYLKAKEKPAKKEKAEKTPTTPTTSPANEEGGAQ